MYDFLVVFCGKLKEKLPINTPPKVYAFLLHLYCQLFFEKKQQRDPQHFRLASETEIKEIEFYALHLAPYLDFQTCYQFTKRQTVRFAFATYQLSV